MYDDDIFLGPTTTFFRVYKYLLRVIFVNGNQQSRTAEQHTTLRKVGSILSSHRLLPGVKLAESLASPQQIDLTGDDNDVAGRLLLLNENSTSISGHTETVTATNVPENQDLPASQTLLDEELAPIIEETVQELHSPIGIVDEVVQASLGVVEEEKTKQDSTPIVNAVKRISKTTLSQMKETCGSDKVWIYC